MTGFGGIGSISQAIGALDENLQFTDNLSMVKGKHNIRAGIPDQPAGLLPDHQLQRQPDVHFRRPLHAACRRTASGSPTSCWASPARRGRRHRRLPSRTSRTTYWAGYLQDDWRIVSELHAELRPAVRVRALAGRDQQPEPRLRAGTADEILLAGQGVRPDIVDPDWNNFAPRFGFTWRPPVARRTSSCAAAPASTTRPTTSTRSSSRAPARRSSRRRRIEGDPRHAEPVHARHAAVVHQLAQRQPVHVRPASTARRT